MAEYVTIAPGVEGYAFVDPKTNELVTLESDQLGTDQIDLVPATPADIEGARKGFAAQGGGQKTLGLLEAAASGATFGLTSQTGPRGLALPGAEARSQVLQQQNPLLEGTARVAGTMLPALATGAGAAALGARGLAGRAAAFVAEDLTQAAAYEVSEATQQDRDIDVGNIAQGLLEGAAFLGLAHGAARGFRAARNAGRGAEEIGSATLKEADAASAGGPAPSRGIDAPEPAARVQEADATSTLARTREQAAARETAERANPSRTEAKHYAENEGEIRGDINDLAYQAGNSAFGREGSFTQAHSIQYKKQDIAGKMGDANIDRVDEVLEAQADALEQLAARIEDTSYTSAPSKAAARTIRQQADLIRRGRAAAQLEGAGLGSGGGVEDAVLAGDRAKRHLDQLRERFGGHATKVTDPERNNVKLLDEVLDGADGASGLRKMLEDPKIWGKDWARKQAGENKLWSGEDGIITSRAIWQSEFMERAPGAAGNYRTQWGTLPVFQMKDGMVESLLAMGPNKRRQVVKAMETDFAKTKAMTELKAEIGGAEARPALDAIRRDLADLGGMLAEAKRILKIEATQAAFLAKQRKLGKFDLEEALEKVPFVGQAGSIATRGLKKVINERFTPAQAEAVALKTSELRAKIEGRRASAQGGPAAKTAAPRSPGRTPTEGTGRGASAAGFAGLAPYKGSQEEDQAAEIAAVAEETRAIRELDQHSKAATERSMLQLSGAPVDQPPLPSVRERFQGDHANITDAYRANMSRLTQLTNDPVKFIEQSTAAFAGMAQAGHPELAAKLITRLQVGAQYLLANQPPALASSMFEPEGSPVDEVAVLQFAPLWEAVWHPLDTVRDIGARNAPPSAVKALREVHPDVYQRAMTETFRTLAQAGPNVSFETKRYLDNVFGYGAAVGRSFSPAMSNLLASERLNNQPAQRSLGGESVLAPESATGMFSAGPSALRTGT